MAVGPRIPGDEEEAYAWGFMLGYLGNVPEVLADALPDITSADVIPFWLTSENAHAWSRGYENGVAVYSDHDHPEDREEGD